MANPDPSHCFSQSLFGVGPFPVEGGTVACTVYEEQAGFSGANSPFDVIGGYSGSSYGLYPYGNLDPMQALSGPVVLLGYGQNYGYGNYGNAVYPATPFAVVGGYGGDPYGLGPYGSIELNPPFITSAISLDGFRVEVFFSEPMDVENPALLNPASYALISLLAADVTILSVAIGNMSDVNILENITASGATSIILTHTGTTLGGAYRLTVGSPSGDPMALDAPSDISGNPIIVPAQVGELFYATIVLSADFSNGDAIDVFVPLDVGGAGNEVTLTAGIDFAFVPNNPVNNAQNLAAALAALPGLAATNLVDGVPSTTVTVTAVKPTVVGPNVDLSINVMAIAGAITISITSAAFQSNEVVLLAKGEPPSHTVTAVAGDKVVVAFDQEMLSEIEFTPGVEDVTAYGMTSQVSFPIQPSITKATFPYQEDPKKILLDVKGMTALVYDVTIAPSTALSYDGSYIPSEGTGFSAQTVGQGKSTIIGNALSINSLNAYGWEFIDTSGKLKSTSTYRSDVVFNLSGATVNPVLGDADFATITVDDGLVNFSMVLRKRGADSTISIPGIGETPATWDDGSSHTLSIIRNKKANFYSILFDGLPLATTATNFFANPSVFTGVSVVLSANYTTVGFVLESVLLTSTSTVFSKAWNFLHNSLSVLQGSGELARDALLTDRGPLVKGWGDATPATKDNVAVRLNGVPMSVNKVNPYIGKITLDIPIPLMPMGEITVETDYKWFATPNFELGGLNTLGAVLNKWDRVNGHQNPPAHGEQIQDLPDHPKGAPDIHRFPMGVGLGPVSRSEPLYIGHRYHALEIDYTASINSPTTLLLNQNPNAISVDKFEVIPQGETISYQGEKVPLLDWTLNGVDAGALTGEGTYTLIDASSGSYGKGTAAFYSRDATLNFPSSVVTAARFYLNSTTLTLDGVFTGVGFGLHNNYHSYVVGCLVVPPTGQNASNHVNFKYVGILTNAEEPQNLDSWLLGPQSSVTITSTSTFTVKSTDIPSGIKQGQRFQVFEGSQAGAYTIDSIVYQTDGTATLTITEKFPTEPTKLGADTAILTLEVNFEGLYSYVLNVDLTSRTAQLEIFGDLYGKAIQVTNLTTLAQPAESTLQFSTQGEGQIFWGSLSRRSTNSSVWSFYRYGVTPDERSIQGHGLVAKSEMSVLPEDEKIYPWFIGQSFGSSKITSDIELLLKSTTESDLLDESFYYARTEPFLTDDAVIDVDAEFKVDSGILGAGDLQVVVQDTKRKVELSNLLYQEGSPEAPAQLTLSFAGQSGLSNVSYSIVGTVDGIPWEISPPTQQNSDAVAAMAATAINSVAVTNQRSVDAVAVGSDVIISAVDAGFEGNTISFSAAIVRIALNAGVQPGFVPLPWTPLSFTLTPKDDSCLNVDFKVLPPEVWAGGLVQVDQYDFSFLSGGKEPTPRRLLDSPVVSASGLYVPNEDPSGVWASVKYPNAEVHNKVLTTSQWNAESQGYYEAVLDKHIRSISGTVSLGYKPQDGRFDWAQTLVWPEDFQIPSVDTPTRLFTDKSWLGAIDALTSGWVPGASVSVLGQGTKFRTELQPGDSIKVKDTAYVVDQVFSDTWLTLTTKATDTVSGAMAYAEVQTSVEYGILETTLAIESASLSTTGETFIYVWLVRGTGQIILSFREVAGTKVVALLSQEGIPQAEYNFNWGDTEFHTYRVLIDDATSTVSLIIDDLVYGVTPLAQFTANPGEEKISFGHWGETAKVHWKSLSLSESPTENTNRTLGVWLGGNRKDLNRWEVPRSDTSTSPNSSPDAVIKEMDWRSTLEVRIHRDPTWGVTVIRPDLPPPPYWDNLKPDGFPGGDFTSEITDPSAGWINVEYRSLPRVSGEVFGGVQFGALAPDSITQQKWKDVRYRIYKHPNQDYRSPEHMVLNEVNILTSAERVTDVTPEMVTIESLDKSTVSLLSTRIYADYILKLIENGKLISAYAYSFDKDTQTITLGRDSDNNKVWFSQDHAAVTVVYAPGMPVTDTYLKAQPLLDSAILLNEGTPPFQKDQAKAALREIVFGSQVNDPMDQLNDDPDFILNDPYRAVAFSKDPSSIYEDLKFFKVSEGQQDLISSICEGTLPTGVSGWVKEGTDFIQGHTHVALITINSTIANTDKLSFDVPIGLEGTGAAIELEGLEAQAHNALVIDTNNLNAGDFVTINIPQAVGGFGMPQALMSVAGAPVANNEFQLLAGDNAGTANNIRDLINSPLIPGATAVTLGAATVQIFTDGVGIAGNSASLQASVGSVLGFNVQSPVFLDGKDLSDLQFNIAHPHLAPAALVDLNGTAVNLATLINARIDGVNAVSANANVIVRTDLPNIDHLIATLSAVTTIPLAIALNGTAGPVVMDYDPLYSVLVTSTVPTGDTVGAHVLAFKGTLLTEFEQTTMAQPAFQQGGGMPPGPYGAKGGIGAGGFAPGGATILRASGGNFVNTYMETDPTKSNYGEVITYPLGGNLGPGTAVMYPSYPAMNMKAGMDAGGIYRRTRWWMDYKGMVTNPLEPDGVDLAESVHIPSDNNTTSAHADVPDAPNGPIGPFSNGACFATFAVDGNYSHSGPWGGLESLVPGAQEQVGPEIGGNPVGLPFTTGSLLYGSSSSQPTGVPASGSGMVLQGGHALPVKGTHNFIIQPTQ